MESARVADLRESTPAQYTAKGLLLSLTALCLAGITVWFTYVQFFTKGLARLPATICDGTVGRDTVTKVLPPARSAEEGARRGSSGSDQVFSCHVITSDEASLLGRSWVRAIPPADWLGSYVGDGGNDQVVSTSVDGIVAVAQLDGEQAAVYVPCASPTVRLSGDSDHYAIITELDTSGDTRATGTELRQTLTDIAYQLSKRAYALAKCQGPREIPGQLPRYGSR